MMLRVLRWLRCLGESTVMMMGNVVEFAVGLVDLEEWAGLEWR